MDIYNIIWKRTTNKPFFDPVTLDAKANSKVIVTKMKATHIKPGDITDDWRSFVKLITQQNDS